MALDAKNPVIYRIRQWWRTSSLLKRVLSVIGIVLVTLCIALATFVWYLLSPAASIGDYAAYYQDDTTPISDGDLAITFFGVSTVLLDDGETQLLVDAFFTRPSKTDVLGTMQSDADVVADFVARYEMDRVRGVFVAHSHYDHALDLPAVADLTGATIYGTESTLNIARGGGIAEPQLRRIADGDTVSVGAFAVRIVESPHSVVPGITPPDVPPQIEAPLEQPATNHDFAEGGNFSFVITRGDRTLAIVPSANYREGALAGIDADVLLLGTALLGMQSDAFQRTYLDETIGLTTPELVLPLHWDDFTVPWKAGDARLNPRIVDAESAKSLDLVIERAERAGAEFVILQAGSRLVVREDS